MRKQAILGLACAMVLAGANTVRQFSKQLPGNLKVEQALNRIFDLSMTSDGLSPLAENIVELMVGERGVTGKILKPYFQAALRRILEPSSAERLIRHITALYLELEWKVQHPTPAPLGNEPAKEPDRGG